MIESRFSRKNVLDETAKAGVRSALTDALAARPEVGFAYIHGSFVKGREFRDVDVAVHAPEVRNPLAFESDVSLELSARVGLPVEVRLIHSAPVALQMAAVRDGIVILSRSDDARADFIEDVGRRYRDYAHFRNLLLGERP